MLEGTVRIPGDEIGKIPALHGHGLDAAPKFTGIGHPSRFGFCRKRPLFVGHGHRALNGNQSPFNGLALVQHQHVERGGTREDRPCHRLNAAFDGASHDVNFTTGLNDERANDVEMLNVPRAQAPPLNVGFDGQ